MKTGNEYADETRRMKGRESLNYSESKERAARANANSRGRKGEEGYKTAGQDRASTSMNRQIAISPELPRLVVLFHKPEESYQRCSERRHS